ncbi:metallophosphoesterase [Pedobacter sp. SD-b]|uniref:Metallophosphoesterase n=1 Tax=Pedobacter segetis TaxID=2793069 RepID=A0ABS1BH81_9SPHI|nr:metallophosphoesterase [Pedobacter segetis]MBK0382202.1 metallophosphoesterase [Pedobacter segetis]
MKRKINLLPIIVFALILVILNWYVTNGLLILFPDTIFQTVFSAMLLLIAVSFVVAILRIPSFGMDVFFKIATHSFIIIFVAEIVAALILFIGDITRIILAFLGNHSSVGYLPTRIVTFSIIAFIAFIIVILIFIDGIVRGKYAYRVIKKTLFFDDLPAAFDGFTITQISDVHSGSFDNKKAVQKGIDLINAQKSDLFVFTGDLVNNKADEIIPWIALFKQIKADYGKFSILGNHDYGDYIKWNSEVEKRENLQNLKKHHQEIGFRLLLDEHIDIEKEQQKIILAGVENWGVGFGERGDLNKALTGTNKADFKILLSHDPSHFDAQIKIHPSKINLTLSGHTHGMQFGIEVFGIKWSPVKYRYKHWAGLKEEFGRYLYINRGFGFLGFSGRIGIWPEITVIELKRK